MPVFHTRYNHEHPVSPHGGVSMTDQQFLPDCDINCILKQFAVKGEARAVQSGVYGDFSTIGDFRDCLERINHAKGEFEALPADLRSRFGNDPVAYVDFVLNPENVNECVKLGLRVVNMPAESAVDVLKQIKDVVTPKETSPSNHGKGSAS